MRTRIKLVLVTVIHLNACISFLGCHENRGPVSNGSLDDGSIPWTLIEKLEIEGIIYATRSDSGSLIIVSAAGSPIETSKFTQLFNDGFQERYVDDPSVEGLIIYGSSLVVKPMGSGSARITVVKVRDGKCLLRIDHKDVVIAPSDLVASVQRRWLDEGVKTE